MTETAGEPQDSEIDLDLEIDVGGITDLEREQRVFDLLAEAGDLEGEAREGLFARHEPSVVAEVRGMLEEDEKDPGFLPTTELAGPSTLQGRRDDGSSLEAGAEIGPYRIVELLGAGGMGRVYLAEQTESRRRVALKFLDLSLDFPHARKRFETECRALARLDHPNVSRFLDAGSSDRGAPFLVMEFIDGQPITSYCDHRSLPISERLALFAEVCHGAEHAHRHALLHRDIKPGNVLVAEAGGRARPKLIDFGIVKMLDASQMVSLTGPFLIGTPAYMSPEALSQERQLDPRSDVYSLGVVLYELLTGTLPHPNVGGSIVAVHLQRMQQGPPEAPGARLAGLSPAERETTARRRGTTASSLITRLAGGLDRVALRAIAEIPDQRFGSAAELAAAVERYSSTNES